jgi:CheY-like chemotaxis protein
MKTFISSTYEDLVPYRDRVAQAIERLGHQAIRMETFGARPDEASRACIEEIQSCDTFVGLYAHRYGHVPAGTDQSITEAELDFALKSKLPVFCYLVDESFPWKPGYIDIESSRTKLVALKDRINRSLVRDTFTTPDDLAFKVAAALGRFSVRQRIMEELREAPAQGGLPEFGLDQVSRRAVRIGDIVAGARLLIVNDRPSDMRVVIRIFEELKTKVVIAEDTKKALSFLAEEDIDAVVSDMTRGQNKSAGLDLLTSIRAAGLTVPVIFTVGNFDPGLGTPANAFGITNRVDELLNLVFDALERLRG